MLFYGVSPRTEKLAVEGFLQSGLRGQVGGARRIPAKGECTDHKIPVSVILGHAGRRKQV